MASTTQATSTSATSSSSTTTSTSSAQITNPSFFGYESQSVVNNDVVYVTKNCAGTSTFFTSNTYVACCSGACTPFTGCLAGSTLIGPSTTQTCSASLTCKTDVVYATQGAAVSSQAVYCGTGPGVSWYRALPPNGVDASIPTSVSTPQSGNGTSLGGPVGGALGGVFFLVIVGVLLCVCGGCGLGGKRSSSNTDTGPDNTSYNLWYQAQQDQQERNRLNGYDA